MDELGEDILKAAANGDVDAFERIYKMYMPFVFNVAYRVAGNRQNAEEITQEVFLIVHQKLKSFLFRSSLKTWVYRITTNYAINYAKRESHQQKSRVDAQEALEFIPGPNNVRAHLEEEDSNARVEKLLSVLNPDERACMVLRNTQNLSYEEIAQSLGVNINTVRTRLKRGREKMVQIAKGIVQNEMR